LKKNINLNIVERDYFYFLDKEGHLWHEGTEIIDPRFLFTIFRSLQKTPDGKFLAKCQSENCFIDTEDAPYIVQDIAFHKDSKGNLQQADLLFSGGFMEILDPKTLFVSNSNVLYCQVRKGEFLARFTRKAYFQLTPFLHEERRDHYYLAMKGEHFPITEQAPSV
jgi:hypothetical protein